MHMTVIGAGVLGLVYGLRLATSGDSVSFVVRPSQIASPRAFVIEPRNGSRRRTILERPERVTVIPDHTDVVLVAVRFEQSVSPDLIAELRGVASAPIVVLTPLLPKQRAGLEAAIGRRITPAMPSVSGYLDEHGVVRYWVVRAVATLIDDPDVAESDAPSRRSLEELAQHLSRARIPTHLERDVGSRNAATTIAFFPLIAAVDIGGGIEGVLADKQLVVTMLEAARECEAMGKRIGKVAPWAQLLTRLVGPHTLRPSVAMGRRLFPEVVRFVEAHFGPKLHQQHLAMGEAIVELGREQGKEMPALERLLQLRSDRGARAET